MAEQVLTSVINDLRSLIGYRETQTLIDGIFIPVSLKYFLDSIERLENLLKVVTITEKTYETKVMDPEEKYNRKPTIKKVL